MDYPWYSLVPKSRTLQQGDFIENMAIPEVQYTYRKALDQKDAKIRWIVTDWIILTQSCDLNPENKKAGQYIILCPVSRIDDYSMNKSTWGGLIRNKAEAFHALREASHPISDGKFLLVDFREAKYAKLSVVKNFAQAQGNGPRLRLNSPYLENLSKRFGNYFSRVAYPKDFPDKQDSLSFRSGNVSN